MYPKHGFALAVMWMLSLVVATGCAKSIPEAVVPELAPVSGVVKLDGKPLAGANVQFSTKSGGIAYGVTDASGKYSLKFNDRHEGGPVGENTVRIMKFNEEKGPDGNPMAGSSLIPARFNDTTILTASVKPKSPNEVNFDLQSR